MTNHSLSTISISAVIIAKNEGVALLPTLESLAFVKEIVVLVSEEGGDSYSVAKDFGAKVVVQKWLGFGAQKNAAVANASYDWMLSIDADEVVSHELMLSIKSAAQRHSTKVVAQDLPIAYRCRRINHFLDKPLYFGEGGNDWLIRFFHRDYAKWSERAVHERLILASDKTNNKCVANLNGVLRHYSAQDLAQYLQKQMHYSQLAAKEKWARVLAVDNAVIPIPAKMIINPISRFIRFYILKQGFRDGWAGFAHIVIGCYATFMKYLFLWSLMKKR